MSFTILLRNVCLVNVCYEYVKCSGVGLDLILVGTKSAMIPLPP